MWHTTFVAVHAAAGVLAFVAGAMAVRRRAMAAVYFWAVVLLVLFMVASVASAWAELGTTPRLVFSGLLVLGAYMLWRAAQARQVGAAAGSWPSGRFVEHVGFNLIALFDGFAIVGAIDLGAPAWLVAAIAVAGVVVGNVSIRNVKSRLTDESPEIPPNVGPSIRSDPNC